MATCSIGSGIMVDVGQNNSLDLLATCSAMCLWFLFCSCVQKIPNIHLRCTSKFGLKVKSCGGESVAIKLPGHRSLLTLPFPVQFVVYRESVGLESVFVPSLKTLNPRNPDACNIKNSVGCQY